jgi:SAM-dependent methyltransferase
MNKHFIDRNREFWEEATPVHTDAPYYNISGFKAGNLSLHSIELEELGQVSAKRLLHLQCHLGLDTLSWARLGARATGVDFSEKSIRFARSLSAETGVSAEFICSDIYSLPDVIKGKFDIVFTSYGTITWLPDLNQWARVIAHFLEPGGIFYIVDGHPFSLSLSNEAAPSVVRVAKPYFHSPEPLESDDEGYDYANPSVAISRPTYEWTHGMGDIVTALASAGLTIVFLHEFPFCEGKYFEDMLQDGNGWWWFRDPSIRIPQTFSLKAIAATSPALNVISQPLAGPAAPDEGFPTPMPEDIVNAAT